MRPSSHQLNIIVSILSACQWTSTSQRTTKVNATPRGVKSSDNNTDIKNMKIKETFKSKLPQPMMAKGVNRNIKSTINIISLTHIPPIKMIQDEEQAEVNTTYRRNGMKWHAQGVYHETVTNSAQMMSFMVKEWFQRRIEVQDIAGRTVMTKTSYKSYYSCKIYRPGNNKANEKPWTKVATRRSLRLDLTLSYSNSLTIMMIFMSVENGIMKETIMAPVINATLTSNIDCHEAVLILNTKNVINDTTQKIKENIRSINHHTYSNLHPPRRKANSTVTVARLYIPLWKLSQKISLGNRKRDSRKSLTNEYDQVRNPQKGQNKKQSLSAPSNST